LDLKQRNSFNLGHKLCNIRPVRVSRAEKCKQNQLPNRPLSVPLMVSLFMHSNSFTFIFYF